MLLLRKVADAAVAAFPDVTLGGTLVCDSADPAADFAVLLAAGFLKTLDAADAAFFPVTSVFLAISRTLEITSKLRTYLSC